MQVLIATSRIASSAPAIGPSSDRSNRRARCAEMWPARREGQDRQSAWSAGESSASRSTTARSRLLRLSPDARKLPSARRPSGVIASVWHQVPSIDPSRTAWRNPSARRQFPDLNLRSTTHRRQRKPPVGRDGHVLDFVVMGHGRAGERAGLPVPVANLTILVAGE